MSDMDSSRGHPSDTEIEKALEPQRPQNKQPQGPEAPDGGTRAWLVVFGTFCVSFCSFGWLNSIGVFQEYYQNGPLHGYSESTVSWIPSLQIFFMMAMGPVIGTLFDKFGPRELLAVGSFMHVFGLMMASISTEYYQFLLSQGVCSAIGVSAIFQSAIACIPGWFTTKRGAAYGLSATGSSIGGIIFPIMMTRLIPQIGYPWAMRTAAFLILFLLIIANVTIQSFTPPRPQKLTKAQLAQPFKEVPFLGVVGGMILLTFGIYIPINYIQVEALHTGMSPNLAGYLVTILNAGSLFGRLLSGIAGDKVGRFNAFIVSCFFTALFTIALWIPGSQIADATARQSATIAFTVLFGFFSGAYVSLIGALVAQISPPREIGFRTGLVFFFASVPGLVTNPIAGAIIGSGISGWTGIKVYSGVMMLAGTACVLGSRVKEVGWKLNEAY